MAGVNPYIQKAKFELPTQTFTVKFLPEGKVFQVDPTKIPYNRTGLPGSILDIAEGAGIDIDHACGGVAACSTCHVIVDKKFYDKLNAPSEDEEDMLDLAFGLTPTSRLGCQIIMTKELDGLTLIVPDETRNISINN